MKPTFQFGLPRQMAGLLLLLSYLAVSDGHAADAVALPPEGSAPASAIRINVVQLGCNRGLLGKLPVNTQLAAYSNVVKPRQDGADWQLRFQVQFLFPK